MLKSIFWGGEGLTDFLFVLICIQELEPGHVVGVSPQSLFASFFFLFAPYTGTCILASELRDREVLFLHPRYLGGEVCYCIIMYPLPNE